MANLNSSSSSRSRNLLWLSEQQEKLAAANRSRRSPSPNSNQKRPVPAPKPQLTKPSPPPQPPPPISSLAFSNPIYDEYRGPAEPISNISSSSAQEPDQQKRTVKSPSPPPPSFPVPKPRKSLANTSSVGVLSPKSPHLNLKPETSNSSTTSSSSNTSSSASSIENCIDEQQQQQLLLRQRRLDLTASDSVHSFLYFEQELPAKMTALINEIETLAESLASSGPDEEEEEEKEELNKASDPVKEQPSLAVGTFRRKRIQVQKELFKFSFSSGSDMLPSPVSVLSPEEFSGRELADSDSKPTPTKHNTDSGVFSSGDNEITTVSEVSNVTSFESKVEKGGKQQKSATSIPPSPPPPQLPPRKNHPQYQKEPKAIENLVPPSLAPSPVPSNYSTSTIPSKPPPPIPKLQRQKEKAEEESPPPQQKDLPETSNEQTSSSSSSASNHNNTSSNDQNITTTTTSAAPKPPQPPATPLTPLLLNSEVLAMEHLHTTKLSLQRSGYLWKTGPNFKSFKYRWCILHRQNLDLADASFSYYFNRSSISASLSGKIMVSEMEYVGVCEAAPAKTRLPKFEKGRERSVDAASAVEKRNGEKGGGGSSSVVFLEIGVRCRGGRVFLLAARAPADRQLWLHAFVQALCLHAFKNKELYAFGFLRAKFTVSSGRWASAFALLTADRFLYVFEVEAGSPVRAVHCRTYQAYNLRKTVRIGRLDEAGGAVLQPQQPSSSGAIYENVNECKYGFSVTQNGGRVVYLVADHPEHSARWYRAVLKFWPSPEDPARCTFEEQYLTRENIPVAVDKCLKFLDTYSTVAAKSTLFKAPPLFANIEQVHPLVLANSTRLLGELRANAWAVHLLPAVHSAQQVSLLLLLYLRSLAQCILTEVMLPAWMKLAEKLEKVEKEEEEGGDEEPEVTGVEDDEHVDVLEAVKSRLQALPPIHYATLRRVILCLANVNMQYPLSTSLCKALVFSKGQQQQKTTPTSAKAPVSLSSARTLITAFIKHHLYLFEVTKEEVDREMHIKRVVHLIINQRTEECLQAQQQQMMMAGMAESTQISSSSSYPTNISKPVLPKTVVVPSSSMSVGGGGGLPLTVVDTKQVSSLIIAIKVNLDDGGVLGGGGGGGGGKTKPSVVNVHLNKETTAADVLDMVLEKSDLRETDRGEYALFEVLCYRRLERLVRRAEPVLPIVLSWSSWRQSHWCAEAGLEVRHGDSLMRGGSLALLHNREKYQHLLSSSSSSSSSSSAEGSTGVSKGGANGGGGGGRLLVTTSHHLVSKRTSQSMKVRPTAAVGGGGVLNKNPSTSSSNSNQMLMSVIRYCGQSDTRLAGSILAEFSSGCLFLYCKASHQLVGQHSVEDIFWYVGLESASLVAAQQSGSPSSAAAEDGSKKRGQQNVNNSSSSVKQGSLMAVGNGTTGDQLNVPALTIVDRRLLTVAQSKDRLNFGQTLLFTSWNELYQWMRALMAAGEKVINAGGGRR